MAEAKAEEKESKARSFAQAEAKLTADKRTAIDALQAAMEDAKAGKGLEKLETAAQNYLAVEENDRINTIVRFQAVELEGGSAAAEVKSVVTSRLRSIDDRVDRILRQIEQLSAHLSSPFLLSLASSLRSSFAAA